MYSSKKPSTNVENSKLLVLAIVMIFVGSILIYRIFNLQIVNGAQALEDFTLKIQKERSIPSTRGNIYDRNGKILAHNKLAYNVTIEDIFEAGNGRNELLNETLLKMIRLIEKNGDRINGDFNIILDENGNYAYTVSDTRLRRFKADIYGFADPGDMLYEQETATAEEMMAYLAGYSRYGVGKSLDPANPRDSFVMGEGYSKEEVLAFASQIKEKLAALQVKHKHSRVAPYVTVSQGIFVKVPEGTNRLWDFTYCADLCLYYIKRKNRNDFFLSTTVQEIKEFAGDDYRLIN